tara:strand:+ start:117 stop:401 length:285 start_codon:yes stop_codon:yes gene_type:complete
MTIRQSKLWARVCDITGEGMNEGYVLEDGTCIIKYEKDLIKELRDMGDEEYNNASDEFILKEAYENEVYYWTEWECPSDITYMEDGQGNITAID